MRCRPPIASSPTRAASGPSGLGGVMGGESTGCDDDTTDVFLEAPGSTAGDRPDGARAEHPFDAQYRFARGVDPVSVTPGLELATRLILDLLRRQAVRYRLRGRTACEPCPLRLRPRPCEAADGHGPGRRPDRDHSGSTGLSGSGRPRRSGRTVGRHPAVVAARCRRTGRSGRGGRADRGFRQPARRGPAAGRRSGGRGAEPAPGPRPHRPPRPGVAGIRRGRHLVLHQTVDRRAVRRRRRSSGAGKPHRGRSGLHAPLGAAESDSGRRPQRRARLRRRRPVRDRPHLSGRRAQGSAHRHRRPGRPPRRPALGRRGRDPAVRAEGRPERRAGGDRRPGRLVATGAGAEPRTGGAPAVRPAATGAEECDGRVRRTAPARPEGAGRRRPHAGVRNRAGQRARAARQSGQGARVRRPVGPSCP